MRGKNYTVLRNRIHKRAVRGSAHELPAVQYPTKHYYNTVFGETQKDYSEIILQTPAEHVESMDESDTEMLLVPKNSSKKAASSGEAQQGF